MRRSIGQLTQARNLLVVADLEGCLIAARIRQMLNDRPHNDRSRFFDFEVNNAGLEVTTC